MPTLPLSGKSALVTGGARRVGHAIALALGAAGADVCLTYRTSSAEAERTAREIEALGRRAFAIPCDVRSEASVREAVGSAAEPVSYTHLIEQRRLGDFDAIFQA